MDAIGGWFAGKAAEKELNSVGEGLSNMVDDASRTVTNWWDSMMGKTQKPLPEFLAGFGLPGGVMPKNLSRYQFEPTEGKPGEGRLTVTCPFTMEVRFNDGTILQYRKTVIAKLSKGKLENIDGVRMSGIMWADISAISAEGDKVTLQARLKKTKPASMFKTPLEGVESMNIK